MESYFVKSVLKYINEYKKETVLAPLFKMLEAAFELAVPMVVASIIDKGIYHNDKNHIILMCGLLALLAIIGLISSITAQYYAAKAAVGFSKKLRHSLFDKIQSLSFNEIDTLGTSSMITRMTSDVNQVQLGVNLVLRLFLRSPFIVFGAMIMAFGIDVKSALVFVIIIPVLSVIVFGIMIITIPLYKKVQSALDKVLEITRQNLTGIKVIRAFCKEKEEIKIFDESNDNLTVLQKRVGRISGLMNPLTYIIINIGVVALVYVGAIRVEAGIITQGAVVALYNYMSQILIELIKLANLIITVTKSVASGKRIESILQMESTLKVDEYLQEVEGNEYAVEFVDVGLAYAGSKEESLSNIDFKVTKGETVGIIGGTGSGKTSLVHLIPHFYDATNGKVKVNGIDVKNYPIDKLRKKIGIVMQKAVLFKGSIRENLLWGNENATDEEIYEALEIAQAVDVVKSKEKGLNDTVSQGGKNFSGGQRQRLSIARALVRKPEILILDDSASALDYATDARLRKALNEMKESPTIFIVSQRTSSIQHADKIIVLDDGKIAGIGKHEELLESCNIYNEIYDSQFRSSKNSNLEVTANE